MVRCPSKPLLLGEESGAGVRLVAVLNKALGRQVPDRPFGIGRRSAASAVEMQQSSDGAGPCRRFDPQPKFGPLAISSSLRRPDTQPNRAQESTMSLALYGHPFSSYTQKVLIALYENGTPFEFRCLGRDTPQHSAEWLRRWPLRKFPLLVDGERNIVETSIIIEYLQLVHPGPVRLLPSDPMAALDVRFLDRFFDLHVINAVQHAVDGALTEDPMKRQEGLVLATKKLERAYAWLERQLAGRTWAAGADFTLADCAAAPSLFYADWTHRISEAFPVLRAYRARLLARPSFARAVEEARPFRPLFPLGAPERD
jgi:glutathione S-transferase